MHEIFFVLLDCCVAEGESGEGKGMLLDCCFSLSSDDRAEEMQREEEQIACSPLPSNIKHLTDDVGPEYRTDVGRILIKPLRDLVEETNNKEEDDEDPTECVVILEEEEENGSVHPALLHDHAVPRRKQSSRRNSTTISSSSGNLLRKSGRFQRFNTQQQHQQHTRVYSDGVSPVIILASTESPPGLLSSEVDNNVDTSNVEGDLAFGNGGGLMLTSSSSKCIQPPIFFPVEDVYACPYCDKRYKLKGSCESHIKIHEGNENACAICGTVMSRQRDLKRHMNTVHRNLLEGQKPEEQSGLNSSHFLANL